MNRTQILRGPGGIVLTLNPSQIFPDDPGNGTPAMVTVGDSAGSYHCVTDQREIMDGRGRTTRLTPAQCEWLEAQGDAVDAFLERGR